MKPRRIVEVALFTEDAQRVRAFYALLLGREPETEWPGGAIFSAGGLELLVHERGAPLSGGPPNEDHVAIGVSDLAGACTNAEAAGLVLLAGPREYPWGRSAYLRDPDGRLVELHEIT